jgi:uncharacterized protein YecT (DUF1311 family)
MKALIAILAIVSSPLFAQESSQYRVCQENAKTQIEMNACARQEAARANALFAEAYRSLLSKVTNRPKAKARIESAERAWIAYRDAYMDAMYPATDKQTEYGSIYPMEINSLLAKLTQRQVTALRELDQQYKGR